ncbi:MAG: type IV pilus assembly protein PilM [Pirellulales bacterium]|nr:type IV pilus assembly protein PilM [Pirellulales bacterium]
MAKSNAVWGIDIGQCALKALRCLPHEKDGDRIVVDSFDYIEYPRILSQPEAEPEELVREALEQFLSRNDLTGDRVAMSVAGQSGLARFIKLPPVESKKIPDIVKYEARQQIPFSLEDVVWDYQQLSGGSEEDGFALEPEVGLFAMKRDQVARALQPLEEAGIEVDFIQLMPLAVYNYICFDLLDNLQAQPYDPQNPPESTVVISLGTDATDLVVTNGYRVWQRNIPIGGSHFTRALSREMKLTFAKAEHLKRNAMQADDPKSVFQAMRPVFSDLLAEIQRSLGYFSSIDKTARIGKVIALGNAMKLPGLQRYLSQNLEEEVLPIEEFHRLSAGSTKGRSQFKDNVLSFAVTYGLCVQGLGKAEIGTNLLPEEIVRSRLIRSKKPWAVAGAAALLLGLTFNYMNHVSAWQDTATPQMADAERKAKNVQSMAAGFANDNESVLQTYNQVKTIRENLISNVEGRLLWLELLKAIDAALPKDPRPPEERQETSEDISNRNELHIISLDMQEYEDLESEYFANVESVYLTKRGMGAEGDEQAEEGFGGGYSGNSGYGSSGGFDAGGGGVGASTSGGLGPKDMVIQLTGYHYHNLDPKNDAAQFVNSTLIKQLEEGTVELPDGENGEMISVPIADLGISRPWVVRQSKIENEVIDPDAALEGISRQGGGYSEYGGGEYGGSSIAVDEAKSKLIELRRFNFVVQFCWQPNNRTQRKEIAEQRRLQAEQEQAEADSAEDESTL